MLKLYSWHASMNKCDILVCTIHEILTPHLRVSQGLIENFYDERQSPLVETFASMMSPVEQFLVLSNPLCHGSM